MNPPDPVRFTQLVILGGSGDLARRKLVPAVARLWNSPEGPDPERNRQASLALENAFGHYQHGIEAIEGTEKTDIIDRAQE